VRRVIGSPFRGSQSKAIAWTGLALQGWETRETETMKILLLNPNTTSAMTGLMLNAGRKAAASGTELIPLTASRGVPYIATRAEAQIGGAIALEMLAEHHRSVDGAIIAAFGDPGLMGARELFDIPVIGMAEAAMLTACMLGRRFSIVTFAAALGPWYRECVELHGLAGRLAGIRMLDGAFRSITGVQTEKEALLVELANRAVTEDGADVVILAGGPLAGLAEKVADRIPVPVVDQIAAAVKQIEALVTLRPRKATAGTFRRPAAKDTIGLAPALAAWIEHRD
jgi:allantoin racemase